MPLCSRCRVEESDSYNHAKCDNCESVLCVSCTGLSASEHKGVAVKKRSPYLIFHCKDCTSPKAVQDLYREVANLQMEMGKKLQDGFDELKANIQKDTLDKIFKAIETTNVALDTLKNANMESNKKMAELDRSLNNFINYLGKDKMDKILKSIELTKAIMATQKSENQQITKKMEELTMSWDGFVKNCAKTNAATIHSPPVRSTDNTKEFKDMQIALKHLNTKIDAHRHRQIRLHPLLLITIVKSLL